MRNYLFCLIHYYLILSIICSKFYVYRVHIEGNYIYPLLGKYISFNV